MPTKPPTKGGKKLVRNINIAVNAELHQQLKMSAALEGLTLKDFIIRAAVTHISPEIFTTTAKRKKGGATEKK